MNAGYVETSYSKVLILQKNMHKYKILTIDMWENESSVKNVYAKKLLLLIMDKIKETKKGSWEKTSYTYNYATPTKIGTGNFLHKT